MLHLRILAALVFTPALLWAVYCGGLTLQLTCFVLSQILLLEFVQLALQPASRLLRGGVLVLGALRAAAILGWLPAAWAAAQAQGGFLVLLTLALLRPQPLAAAMQRVGLGCLGIAWCSGMLPLLARLREASAAGLVLAVLTILCTWAGDTAAYAGGRLWGRRRLYPAVSPSKTWEGALCGLAGALLSGGLLGALLPGGLTPAAGALLGGACAIAGLIGDLCESMLKRSVAAKDSSRLIPGHGGLFDRFDGIVFAVGVVWLLAPLVHTAP